MSSPALKQHLKKLPFISYPAAGDLPQLSHPSTWGWTLPLCLQMPRVGFVIHCTAAVSQPSGGNHTWLGVEETVCFPGPEVRDRMSPSPFVTWLHFKYLLGKQKLHGKGTAPLGEAQGLRLLALQLAPTEQWRWAGEAPQASTQVCSAISHTWAELILVTTKAFGLHSSRMAPQIWNLSTLHLFAPLSTLQHKPFFPWLPLTFLFCFTTLNRSSPAAPQRRGGAPRPLQAARAPPPRNQQRSPIPRVTPPAPQRQRRGTRSPGGRPCPGAALRNASGRAGGGWGTAPAGPL